MPIAAHRLAGADQQVAVRRAAPAARCCAARPLVCSQSTRAVGRRDAGRAARRSAARSARRRRSSPDAASCSRRRWSGRTSAASRWQRRRRRAGRRRRRSRGRRPPAASSRSPSPGPSRRCRTPRCATTRRAPLRGVERVQDAGRAERVDAAVAERRRAARTGAGIRFPEPGRVAVSPHRLAGAHRVAGDDLVVAALLLGVEEIAVHREGRPARPDRPAPQLDRRRLAPSRSRSARRERRRRVRVRESRASSASLCAAIVGRRRGRAARKRRLRCGALRRRARTTELATARSAGGGGRWRRRPPAAGGGGPPARRRLCARSRSSGVWRPPPVEVRAGVAGDAAGANQRERCRTPAGSRRPSTRAAVRWRGRRLAAAQATSARLRTGMA